MKSLIEETYNTSRNKKLRRFVFVYRAIFFILGLAGISVTGVLIIFNISNTSNVDFMTRNTIENSAVAFKELERNTVNMLSATLEGLVSNQTIGELFYMRDGEQLYQFTRPIYQHLKLQNGITHWYFITPEPDQTCFLRVHNPGFRNDKNMRFTLQKCISTGQLATGSELGKTALALRAVHPFYHKTQLIGYIELGVEMAYLFRHLKKQTGHEYGLLIEKKYLNRADWMSVVTVKGARDNWDDMTHHLLVTSTSIASQTELLQKNLDNLSTIPDEGLVLGMISVGDTRFVRGVFPFYDAMGRKVGGVFILKDISNTFNAVNRQKKKIVFMLLVFMGLVTFLMIFFHKRAETELRQYRKHLEETVHEATAELRETNRKLNLEIEEHKLAQQALETECQAREIAEKKQISAIKQVEQSARLASIGVMAAGITHEINQPLNAIKVTADSIQYWQKRNPNALPEPFIEQLNLISKSVKRIVEIIQNMRAFWVVPDSPAIVAVDINVAVANALSLIHQQLHDHGIQEYLSTSTNPLMVQGNLIHFEQIIVNIVVNAANALKGKKQVQKKIELITSMDNDHVVLVICDNGPGLPHESIEKLWDPFFSTNSGGEGMGLGLAIVKQYVDRYNGTIHAANQKVDDNIVGARFTLRFPLYAKNNPPKHDTKKAPVIGPVSPVTKDTSHENFVN